MRKEEKRMPSFVAILKSVETHSAVSEAVEKEAAKISKRENMTLEKAVIAAWTRFPEAELAWKTAAGPVFKRETKMFEVTKAQAEIDRRAKRTQRETGCAYGKVVTDEMKCGTIPILRLREAGGRGRHDAGGRIARW
jgi:hypothetical protein